MAQQQQHLIQVILPNNHTILAATLHTQRPTALHLIQAILSDDANTSLLQSIFGSHFTPAKQDVTPSDSESDPWCRDVNSTTWALQAVQVSEANREWKQHELDTLGDGLLPLDQDILSHLRSQVHDPAKSSAFSDFALSAHLHAPRLRLVCGAPGLCVRLAFVHVPDIDDGWSQRLWFLPAPSDDATASGTGSFASEVIEAVIEEFGIRKVVLQGSKSARVEYAIAIPSANKAITALPPPAPLPPSTALPHLLEAITTDAAIPTLLFTVSATWFSRLGTVAMGFAKHARKSVDEAISPGKQQAPVSPSPVSKIRPAPPGVLSLWNGAAAGPSTAKASPSLGSGTGSGDAQLQALTIEHIRSESTNTEDSEGRSGDTLKGQHTMPDSHAAYGSVRGAAAFMNASGASATADSPMAAGSPMRRNHGHKPSYTATARLSRMFESWGAAATASPEEAAAPRTPSRSSTTNTISRSGKTISVSGPLELEAQQTGRSNMSPTMPTSPAVISSPSLNASPSTPSALSDADLAAKFELLMTDLGIKGPSRTAMLGLPDDRKRFLIAQNDASKAGSPPPNRPEVSHSGSPPPSDPGASFIDSVSRATGAWTNRFSIASLTSWGGHSNEDEREQHFSGDASVPESVQSTGFLSALKPTTALNDNMTSDSISGQLNPTHTGVSTAPSLWTSWWGTSNPTSSPSTATAANSQSATGVSNSTTDKTSPHYYAATLASSKLPRKELVKTLIALRVTLASAKLKWIEIFVSSAGEEGGARGLDVIQAIMSKETDALVSDRRTRAQGRRGNGSDSQHQQRDELSDSVITECIKCLRGIMNTDVSCVYAVMGLKANG